MVRLTLENKAGNQKFFLFNSLILNDIIYKELELNDFNILVDIEFVSKDTLVHNGLEKLLFLYKDNKEELRDIFDYMISVDFRFLKLSKISDIIIWLHGKKKIREMLEILKDNVIFFYNSHSEYNFEFLKFFIQSEIDDDIRYSNITNIIKDENNFKEIFGSSIDEAEVILNIRKEKCVLKEEVNVFVINKEKISEVVEQWMKKY